jgi:hypothetical protein
MAKFPPFLNMPVKGKSDTGNMYGIIVEIDGDSVTVETRSGHRLWVKSFMASCWEYDGRPQQIQGQHK